MKKILTLILPLFLAVGAARADVIWQELFQYTNGPIIYNSTNVVGGVMITNWIRYSGTANPPDLIVNNNQLEVSSTGTGSPVSRQDDCGRPFANAPGSTYTNGQQLIYVSFIVNFTNPPKAGTTYFANFKFGTPTSTSYEGKIFASLGSLTNTVRLGVSATANTPSATSAIDLALNTPYQVVVQWDPVTLYALSLWVNPISSSDPSITSGDTFTPTAANVANMIAFRQSSTFGAFLTVSNLVVATTFAEAATNVLATNAVPPTIAYQPAAVTTNFQNDVVNLSAVANGQGQGSLTYQWQVSNDPGNSSPVNVSNPNGNSNVLGVDTSSISTRYYTLVVTTPWGLSTTSSIAKVAIIAPVGPPSFVVQPVSQVAYSGQTVTLTTTVLSPGTPVYTWYSNNVVVTAGQQDSGFSSSYVLNNVNPASSATYKVAVTNETSAIGIVSTNAVLTVQNPSTVSIAYLRSLADANNGYSASPTIPYRVTGTVTTFTNLTFGDTSSYYLQDGTGGINIFATFGSTFRPAQGAVVTFVGVLSSYTSGLELYADLNPSGSVYPYTSATDTGNTAPLPAPISIGFDITNNLNNANYNLAGSLVTLHDVYFGTNSGMVLSNTVNNTVSVTNSSGQQFNLFFAYLDQDTAGQTLPSYAYSVSGVLYGINTSFSVAVTRFADIVTAPPPAPIPLGTVFSGGNITFNWSDSSFYLQTSTNVAGPYYSITGAGSGFTTNITTSPTVFYRLYRP